MKLKRAMLISMSIRITLFLFCFSFIGFRYIVSYIWFKPTETATSIQNALENSTQGINAYNEDGFTGLMLAAIRADYDIAKVLLEHGANPNLRSKNVDPETKIIEGNTALHWAAFNGDASGVDDKSGSYGIISLLVKNAADVNERNNYGSTPLHFLQQIDNLDNRLAAVQLLVQFGAKINAQNHDGNTLLHLSIEAKDQTFLEMMIDYFGSIINFKLKNKQGYDLRGWAQFLLFTDIVELLDKKAPDGVYAHIVGSGNNVNERDKNGMTALMLAVIRQDKPFAERLILRGANVNALARDKWENSALHIALLHDRPNMLKLLLKNNANPNLANAGGLTPIFYILALRRDHLIGSEVADAKTDTIVFEVIQDLMKARANINAQDQEGYTLLHRAIYLHATDIAIFLIDFYGKKINFGLRTKSGKTAYALAQEAKNQKVMQAITDFNRPQQQAA